MNAAATATAPRAHLMMCSVSQFITIFSPKLEPISPGVGSRAPKSCSRQHETSGGAEGKTCGEGAGLSVGRKGLAGERQGDCAACAQHLRASASNPQSAAQAGRPRLPTAQQLTSPMNAFSKLGLVLCVRNCSLLVVLIDTGHGGLLLEHACTNARRPGPRPSESSSSITQAAAAARNECGAN